MEVLVKKLDTLINVLVSAEAKKTIAEEHFKRTGAIDLSNLNLRKIPSQIRHLKWVHCILLNGNEISNLEYLRPLKEVTMLNLSFNNITDISPLSSLSKVHWLDLSGNQIADLTPLANIHELKNLYLRDDKATRHKAKKLKSAMPNTTILFLKK